MPSTTDTAHQLDVKHFHLFCGLGGGAKGFNNGHARIGQLEARFRCLGGIDGDLAAIRDFKKLAGVPGTVLDMFSLEQYVAFHGKAPPPDWSEATVADIHAAAGNERPDIVFLSAPCKGFSGLLSETRSKTAKYQALNQLTLRGVWMTLEAYKDDPVSLFVFENVPRIANRGRSLLDQIVSLLRHYGYAVAETTHDCGELGGLAQSRKRFLLVARHMQKVPPFLYEPEKRSLRAVGEVLGKLPIPGTGLGGAMHRVPALQWKTWVRLAFVEAGKDWRSLNRLKVEDGKLADYLIIPAGKNNGFMGVNEWQKPSGTVAGRSMVGNGSFAVADPRWEQSASWKDGNALGVKDWGQTASTVGAGSMPGQGAYSVADPRHHGRDKFSNEFRIVEWNKTGVAVTGASGSGSCVADPRVSEASRSGPLGVCTWDGKTGAIAGESFPTNGTFSVADPRVLHRQKGDDYLTGGHYGVVPWEGTTGAVSSSACHDNGGWSVADPRMPAATDNMVAIIRALDGTWHRPFTTLELASLQSLVDPEEFLELDGLSDSAWRERVGNAVPSDAAAAIASVMGHTLLLAATGQTFMLSNAPIWVRPIAVGLSVKNATPNP